MILVQSSWGESKDLKQGTNPPQAEAKRYF